MDNQSYRQLEAWQKAMDAYDAVYDVSHHFPDDERFGLCVQIRRAALSIPSNIAEGYGRRRRAEYLYHLYVSRGSLMETETQLIAAVRRRMCERESAKHPWDELQQTGRLLNKLIASLE